MFETREDKYALLLTHWGRATHICVSKLTIIGSDNGLSPDWRQPIIWTNVGLLSFGPLGTIFSEILIGIHTFWFKKNAFENVVWETAAILSRSQCAKLTRALLDDKYAFRYAVLCAFNIGNAYAHKYLLSA